MKTFGQWLEGVAQDQHQQGHMRGKAAAEKDLKFGTRTLNPYRNPKGEIDPAQQNFFNGWEMGYNSGKG